MSFIGFVQLTKFTKHTKKYLNPLFKTLFNVLCFQQLFVLTTKLIATMKKGHKGSKKRNESAGTDEENTVKQSKSSISSDNTQRSKRSKLSFNNDEMKKKRNDFSIPLSGKEITLEIPEKNIEITKNKQSNQDNEHQKLAANTQTYNTEKEKNGEDVSKAQEKNNERVLENTTSEGLL